MPFRPTLLLLLLFSSVALHASTCGPAALSVYDSPGFTCQLGNFTLTDFTYTQLSGTVTIPDTAIQVTPSTGPGTLALEFSSSAFSVAGSDFAHYLLAYTWDADPIRSLEDILNDPVIFPGLAQITTTACIDAAFTGAVCPTTTATITVFDNGVTSQLSDSVSFTPPPTLLGIRNIIELDGNGASASFDSFENQLVIPEPGTLLGGLLALAICIRGRRFEGR
jgi:hypothetical protein